MSFKKIDINEIVLNPFKTIGKDWLLISALKENKINTMTASWGGIGVIWNKNVVTVYIRPQRYTREFVDASDYFTLTFFEGYKKELGILGSKSGRDGDKIKEVDFDVELLEGQPAFKQGKMVFICKKLYQGKIEPNGFIDDSLDEKNYPDHDSHYIYIGEIEDAYINEKE